MDGFRGQATEDQEVMMSIENTIQSPCEVTPAAQSPKTHAAVPHQPQNGNRDLTAIPGMANMIDTDPEEPDDRNDDQHETGDKKHRTFLPPPGIEDVRRAYEDLQGILKPKRKTGPGHVDPGLNLITRERLEQVCQFLWNYVGPDTTPHGGTISTSWMATSEQTARAVGRGSNLARNLWTWSRAFITDRSLPISSSGQCNESLLQDETLVQEIKLHLEGIGKYAKAMDIVHFLDTLEMKERLNRKTTIGITTANRWMHELGFSWGNAPKGQYVDGHKREDTVAYRQDVFLSDLDEIDAHTRRWTNDGTEDTSVATTPDFCHIVVWYHDKSTFYANDRRKVRWASKDEKAVPQPKGEGASLMVADFVSADYGWLRSQNGEEDARVLLKAGRSRGGYFTNEDVLKQVQSTMDILKKHYPNDDHIFVFDNATTHLKRPDEALSAQNMPKFTPKEGTNWGPETNMIGNNGRPVYGPDGKVVKIKTRMADGRLADGTPQPLYFPLEHPQAGVFKGMSIILKERGLLKESNLKAQCKDFKCKKGVSDCCCRRVLYTQPDFIQGESRLETLCKKQGFNVLFLPKFHCELNFIEQCWGYAKRVYREYPASSKEVDLEHNVVSALESVPLVSMRKCVHIIV